MIQNIATTIKVTKPENCILGCCLPLTKEEFFNAYNRRVAMDFISSQLGNYSSMTKEALWIDIYSRFAKTINKSLDFVENLGVTVIRNFALNKLYQIKNYEVFTLFTHFSKTTGDIEFFDGLYSKEKFVEELDITFKGIFDLTVCNSDLIRNVIKKKFSAEQVISFEIAVPLLPMILLYKQVVLNLSRNDINYIDCYLKTLDHLNEKKNEKITIHIGEIQ